MKVFIIIGIKRKISFSHLYSILLFTHKLANTYHPYVINGPKINKRICSTLVIGISHSYGCLFIMQVKVSVISSMVFNMKIATKALFFISFLSREFDIFFKNIIDTIIATILLSILNTKVNVAPLQISRFTHFRYSTKNMYVLF